MSHLDSVSCLQAEKWWRVSYTQQVQEIVHRSKDVSLLRPEGWVCQSWFDSEKSKETQDHYIVKQMQHKL